MSSTYTVCSNVQIVLLLSISLLYVVIQSIVQLRVILNAWLALSISLSYSVDGTV